jgi:hypothetical protein
LGRQGLLTALCDGRVRLIQGRAQRGELALILFFARRLGSRRLIFGLGLREEGAGSRSTSIRS